MFFRYPIWPLAWGSGGVQAQVRDEVVPPGVGEALLQLVQVAVVHDLVAVDLVVGPDVSSNELPPVQSRVGHGWHGLVGWVGIGNGSVRTGLGIFGRLSWGGGLWRRLPRTKSHFVAFVLGNVKHTASSQGSSSCLVVVIKQI